MIITPIIRFAFVAAAIFLMLTPSPNGVMKPDRRYTIASGEGILSKVVVLDLRQTGRLSKRLVTNTIRRQTCSSIRFSIRTHTSASAPSVLSNGHYQFRWVTCDAAALLSVGLRNQHCKEHLYIEVVLEFQRAPKLFATRCSSKVMC